MSEKVYRIRGGGLDSNNDRLPESEPFELIAKAVEPGSGSTLTAVGRNGKAIAYTVYFVPAVDLTEDDHLIVRGARFGVEVGDWRSPYGTGRTAMVVSCTLGKG